MQFCHFCGMQSFVSANFQVLYLFQLPLLQQVCKTARQEVCPSQPPAPAAASFRRHRRRSRPRPGGQRPSSPPPPAGPSRRRPRPALAVVAVVRCRCRPSARCRRRPSSWLHVPRSRQRRCCGPLLRRGRPRRWRPPRPSLRRHCRRRNSTAGNLPKAYQIMRNDATWKMNRYLCSLKIHATMGVSRSNTHAK